MSRIAKPGTIWVCAACWKKHRDQYGIQGDGSRGWDERCALNAVLCWDKGLIPYTPVPADQVEEHTTPPEAKP